MQFLNKLRNTLRKTSEKFSIGIDKILFRGKFDKEALAEIEELLLASDLGFSTTDYIVKRIASYKPKTQDLQKEIKELLREEIANILRAAKYPEIEVTNDDKAKPEVIMICGVNGNGKTTTVAKLAYKFQQQGKNVVIAACDTFRAAAVEQLQEWSHRIGCKFVKGEDSADPASVSYKALQIAKEQAADILIIDTAGRLHSQNNLMAELDKCKRVLQKLDKDAPHQTILILDATTGQNALSQVEFFRQTINISCILLTKLDGTAKGGIAIAIAHKFQLPIYMLGVGENIEDLQDFNPEDFASALITI